jgi:hypothetical protein
MGSFITVPKTLHTQESVEEEVNRLLHSYSYLLKGISNKGTIDKFDVMKQSLIHQQWGMVFPLLHSSKKEKYNKKFQEYVSNFQSWKHIGLSPIQELEEKLLD